MDIPRNGNLTVFPSAVRAATVASADMQNRFGKGIILFINMVAVPGGDTVTFTIQGRIPLPAKPAAGTYYTILASTALVGTGLTVLRVYPGLTAAANLVVSDVLPVDWRINAAHSGAGNFTYTVTANILL